MRYTGQGHELAVSLPLGGFDTGSRSSLAALFQDAYSTMFGRVIPGLDVEIMNWTLRLAAAQEPQPPCPPQPPDEAVGPAGKRAVFSTTELSMREVPVYRRVELSPGSMLPGPAVIAEDETTTIVPRGFVARLNPLGAIVLEKETP